MCKFIIDTAIITQEPTTTSSIIILIKNELVIESINALNT